MKKPRKTGGRDDGCTVVIYFSGLFLQVSTRISSKCPKHLFLASILIKEPTISLKEQVIGTSEVPLNDPLQRSLSEKRALATHSTEAIQNIRSECRKKP